jgi:hypothetical protein
MTIVGVLLFFGSLISFGLIFSGAAPEALAALPVPGWAWLAGAAAGALLIMLNRRPGN